VVGRFVLDGGEDFSDVLLADQLFVSAVWTVDEVSFEVNLSKRYDSTAPWTVDFCFFQIHSTTLRMIAIDATCIIWSFSHTHNIG